jgi:hypothetical protein
MGKNRFPFLSKFIFKNISKEERIWDEYRKGSTRRGEDNQFHLRCLKSEVYGNRTLRFDTYFSINVSSTNTREKKRRCRMFRWERGLYLQHCADRQHIETQADAAQVLPFSGFMKPLCWHTTELLKWGKPLPAQNDNINTEELSGNTSVPREKV